MIATIPQDENDDLRVFLIKSVNSFEKINRTSHDLALIDVHYEDFYELYSAQEDPSPAPTCIEPIDID